MNIEKLSEFQHKYSPLHVYCRLRELEISKKDSLEVAKYYRDVFYNPLLEVLKTEKYLKVCD